MRRLSFALFITLAAFSSAACTKEETSQETPAASGAASPPTATPEQPAAAAKDIDPCTLVDAATVAATFGELKEGPTPGSGLRNEKQCNYTNTSGSWLKLSVYSGKDRWEWERNITNAQNPRDLSGLGDEAFTIKRGTDAVLYARRGESILEVSCSCPFPVAESIARAAVPKL